MDKCFRKRAGLIKSLKKKMRALNFITLLFEASHFLTQDMMVSDFIQHHPSLKIGASPSACAPWNSQGHA